MTTVIIDYGLSNLLSVKRAVEYCGETARISDDPECIETAERLLLPGVGAFADGMRGLFEKGLDTAIKNSVGRGVPLMGICLGMQMLFEKSEEFGEHEGLGLIRGNIVRIPDLDTQAERQHVPNIGWHPVMFKSRSPLFSSFPKRSQVYFVHSYEAKPADEREVLATYEYGGRQICAAAVSGTGNVVGCQFHPEKSGQAGISIIDSFLKWRP